MESLFTIQPKRTPDHVLNRRNIKPDQSKVALRRRLEQIEEERRLAEQFDYLK
ncbi:hypothetical protein HUO05_23745 (plasmid) [Vibrio alginolyticus]|uniref:PA3496 family putative envelope integrity protein n=1 Tax=Vibrio TaxID=662 RepID=UPI0013E941E4|nr:MULTISPECIES: hypothetical protein [Vibrio]EHZ2727219.1 hypothetical protein [Vibrio parahaemolyticus]EIV1599943.1 hypothetical protein [Vibrio parahaemolyticus]MCR9634427.1 hypothetical protein [Vibrio alginolyticus]MDF4876216.1 hypothetical protein [Vibrio parahaemolyticus]MDW2149421.1 hypothetical protein [Vibrio sp. 378]